MQMFDVDVIAPSSAAVRTIRHMKNKHELQLALEWAEKEGWEPGRHDADALYAMSDKAFFVIEDGGKVVGSVAVMPYSEQFGFMGLGIVLPEYRGQKVGHTLLSYGFKKAADECIMSGFNAVYNQVAYYKTFGYEEAWNNLHCTITTPAQPKPVNDDMRFVQDELEKLVQYDASIFGFKRTNFLKTLIQAENTSCLVSYDKQRNIIGYGIIRPCRKVYRLGPLYADDFDTAKLLFRELLHCVADEKIMIDIPEVNQNSQSFIEYFNLIREEVGDTLAMYKQSGPITIETPHLEKRYALGSLELGDGVPSGQGFAVIQEKRQRGKSGKL